jgi:predicted heme/steroid binding protein
MMKSLIFAAVLVAVALANQCFPAQFQSRAEFYQHPGTFFDVGMWVDFTGQRQRFILNPVPGNSNVTAYIVSNGNVYEVTGTPDDNDGYHPFACVNRGAGQLIDQCFNLSQWYGASVGGWNGLGGFKANVYTAGMMVNQTYFQSFLYTHGMGVAPVWLRQFNSSDTPPSYVTWNFYNSGPIKNATEAFTLPSVCNGMVAKPEFAAEMPAPIRKLMGLTSRM